MPVAFKGDVVYSASSDDDDVVMSELSNKFDSEKSTRPKFAKTFSYKTVGRLSKWDGFTSTPYDTIGLNSEGEVEKVKPKDMSFIEFVKQFFCATYDTTEVTREDIERVRIMHDKFLGESQFSFNYSTMLVIASFIAAVGLATDSTATVISSMLISPLMGPVTAMAYGTSIGDYKMVRQGVVTEVTSLMVCIIIGIFVSLICIPTRLLRDGIITDEMMGRSTLETFISGIPIAFFSGLGVAVGLLDSQTNSLVGVAISASLLPPAVNAGMLFILTAFYPKFPRHPGLISLSLTLMNIVVVFVASMIMFRLKETLPIEKSVFWSDLGVARLIYHNVAILPIFQTAPSDAEINRRVTKFFPRASRMAEMHSWGEGRKDLGDMNASFVDIDGKCSNDSLNNTHMMALIKE